MAQSKGLAGIIAGDSAVSTVGLGNGLNYRGYNVNDLAESSTFEEVFYLLLHEKLPTPQELKDFAFAIASQRRLPEALKNVLKQIPMTAHPMDVMRTICSVMGTLEPETGVNDAKKIAIRLVGLYGPALLFWYHFHNSKVEIETQTGLQDSVAKNFMKLLLQKDNVDDVMVKCFDVSLILYAEHDFNASTFTSRVITSTNSDVYSGLTGGIGALRGNLHGGANEAAMEFIAQFETPEQAEAKLRDMFKKKQLVMGFGHRVYKNGDPRNAIIKECSRKLSQQPYGSPKLYKISEHIEQIILKEKKMHANLDFFAASAYFQCGIPIPFYTPIFVISRTSGWVAHILEQRKSRSIIRPKSNYVGPPPTKFTPIEQRPRL